jgi:uncharacterized Ntn-hydrolase superfamily protein
MARSAIGRRRFLSRRGGFALAAFLAAAAPPAAASDLAHTYSIVARDPETGELGVAVQSHWFQVGAVVPWAESGVGAVATQSFVEVSYGPEGLELMRQGLSAQEALDKLVAADPQRDVRQVAMVDAHGRVAAWTGPRCIAAAGHQVGDHYSVQANLMDRPTVWPAMARAFDAARGPLGERLLAALDAAESEGGDIRGRQSAALLVVRGAASGEPYRDVVVNLRVDDHPNPLYELRRLWERHLAYEAMNAGDEALAQGDVRAALARYSKAAGMAPDIVELPFWQAVTLFSEGREAEALPIFARVFAAEPRWAELVGRLPAAGLLPDDPGKLRRILAMAELSATAPADALIDGAVEVSGQMIAEGADCPTLRAAGGEIYVLLGDVVDLQPGDRVKVTGRAAEPATCARGTTFLVDRVQQLQ